MFTFDRSLISVGSISQLEPGQFFIAGDTNGSFVGLRIKDVQGNPAWLILTGENAFQFDMAQRGSKAAFKISIPTGGIKLRVDQASIASNSDHRVGQLVVDAANSAGIAALWPDLADKNYRNIVRIDTWAQSNRDGDALLFDRWALSYVDEAGQWVDIVRR